MVRWGGGCVFCVFGVLYGGFRVWDDWGGVENGLEWGCEDMMGNVGEW